MATKSPLSGGLFVEGALIRRLISVWPGKRGVEARYEKPGAGPGCKSGCDGGSGDFRIRYGNTLFEKHDLVAHISRLSGVVQAVTQRLVLAVHLTDFWCAIVGDYPWSLKADRLQQFSNLQMIIVLVEVSVQAAPFNVVRRVKVDQ